MSALTHREFVHATQPLEAAPRKRWWRRAFEAIAASQMRRAEREIARYLASHGGILTDEAERELMRRFSNGGNGSGQSRY